MSQLIGDALMFLTTFSDHGFVRLRRNPSSRVEQWEVTIQDPENDAAPRTYGGESLTIALQRATQGMLGILERRHQTRVPLMRVNGTA